MLNTIIAFVPHLPWKLPVLHWHSILPSSLLNPRDVIFLIITSWKMENAKGWWHDLLSQHGTEWGNVRSKELLPALPCRAWQELLIGSVTKWLRSTFLSFCSTCKPLLLLPRRYQWHLPTFAWLTSILVFLFDILNDTFVCLNIFCWKEHCVEFMWIC